MPAADPSTLQTIFVLDDGDESWWLIARLDGQTGVVPATYVL